MLNAVCDCVQCPVCGVWLSGIRIHAVCGIVCGRAHSCVRQCGSVRLCLHQCATVQRCGSEHVFSNKFKTYSYKFVYIRK
jgi:hypothetical protein